MGQSSVCTEAVAGAGLSGPRSRWSHEVGFSRRSRSLGVKSCQGELRQERAGAGNSVVGVDLRRRQPILRPHVSDDDDCSLLGVIAAALPRLRRDGSLVTPDTLLRRHRRHTAQHWTQPHRPPGRPASSTEATALDPAVGNREPEPQHTPNYQEQSDPNDPSAVDLETGP
jgi:hypothetical protein